MDISGLMIEVAWRLSRSPSMHNNKSKAEHTNLFNREHSMYTAIVIFVTDEQRQVLKEDGVPMPLVDGDEGKCYMVMPVEFSSERDGVFRARMPGFHAMAEAEVPSDAAMTLAILVRKMLEHG